MEIEFTYKKNGQGGYRRKVEITGNDRRDAKLREAARKKIAKAEGVEPEAITDIQKVGD